MYISSFCFNKKLIDSQHFYMNNLGYALGDAVAYYGTLPDSAKLILSLAMILGRLEVFSLIVLFSPAF